MCKNVVGFILSFGLASPMYAAIITVDSAATGSVPGACTLQDAVKAANTNTAIQTCVAGSVGVDTIQFAPGVNTITLTAPMLAPVASYPSPKQYLAGLVITEDLVIDGQAVAGSGVPAVTIQRAAAQPFTVIYAEGSGPTLNVTLSGLTVSNGNPVYIFNTTTVSDINGGAFAFHNPDFANPTSNKLTVRDCVFTGNTAGVGVYVAGVIDMLNSTVSNNGPLGGMFVGGGDIGYSTFSNNTSTSEAAGGGLSTGGSLRVDHSAISGNTGRYGAGFYGGSGGVQTFTNSVISGNVAIAFGANNSFAPAGGGLYSLGQLVLADSGVSNNRADPAPNAIASYSIGGGIYSGGTGNLTMTRTTVGGNNSGNVGGGIYVAGGSVISASSVDFNHSKAGGGIYAEGPLKLDSSTVSGNTASGGNPAALPSSGGGIYASSALLTDVTVSGNSAARGAGLAIDYQLDAIYVTITANTGTICAGLCPSEHYPNDTFSYNLVNTVVAGNTGGGTDVYGNSAVSGNHSWIGSTSGSVTVASGTTIATCQNLGLAPLANNGGGTSTHAVLSGSCLIGAGTLTSPTTTAFSGPISALTTDQRRAGFPRIVGLRSDIGAFEFQHAAVQACKAATRPIPDSSAFIRYLQGVTGSALMAGLYPAAEVSDAAAATLIADFTANGDAYDFNGDGSLSALVDGELYARYALGIRGAALVAGLAVGVVRTTAQIESALAACH